MLGPANVSGELSLRLIFSRVSILCINAFIVKHTDFVKITVPASVTLREQM